MWFSTGKRGERDGEAAEVGAALAGQAKGETSSQKGTCVTRICDQYVKEIIPKTGPEMRPTLEAEGARPAGAGNRLPDGLPQVAQPLQALPQGTAAGVGPAGSKLSLIEAKFVYKLTK